MRRVNWDLVPDGGLVALLTAHEVGKGEELHLADFRDTHALYYSTFRSWIGLTKTRGLRPGKRDAVLVNGVWYAEEDMDVAGANPDHVPDVSLMSLEIIG